MKAVRRPWLNTNDILDEMNANLDNLFDIRPKAPLKVERVPEFREKTSAGAYYQPGGPGQAGARASFTPTCAT